MIVSVSDEILKRYNRIPRLASPLSGAAAVLHTDVAALLCGLHCILSPKLLWIIYLVIVVSFYFIQLLLQFTSVSSLLLRSTI